MLLDSENTLEIEVHYTEINGSERDELGRPIKTPGKTEVVRGWILEKVSFENKDSRAPHTEGSSRLVLSGGKLERIYGTKINVLGGSLSYSVKEYAPINIPSSFQGSIGNLASAFYIIEANNG